jgi:hypothetical protein
MRRPAPGVCLCLLGVVDAQTYVVDRSGGGNFTTFQQAIDAVPDGSVLRVRAGDYVPFILQNKSLTIIGDAGVVVGPVYGAAGPVAIGPTAANQTIVMKGIAFRGQQDNFALTVRLQNLAGPVFVEDVTVGHPQDWYPGAEMVITGCANTHLLRCSLQGLGYSNVPSPMLSISGSAVELAQCTVTPRMLTAILATASRIALISCTVTGGRGDDYAPTRSGMGAVVLSSGSELHAYGIGGSISGGAGGRGGGVLGPGGNGGTGLSLANSTATLVGIVPVGGGGGAGPPPGMPGAAALLDATSTVRTIVATGPSCVITGTAAPGNAVSLDSRANAGDIAIVLLGEEPLYVAAPSWLTVGTLFVNPLVTFGPFTVPSTGLLSFPLQLPPTLPLNHLFLLQCAVLPSGSINELWASNATSILVSS